MRKAAGQGHMYAMSALGNKHHVRKEYKQAVHCFTKAALAGLPQAMLMLASMLEGGEGVPAPDYSAAVGWYRRASDAGVGDAAQNIAAMYAVGRGRAL